MDLDPPHDNQSYRQSGYVDTYRTIRRDLALAARHDIIRGNLYADFLATLDHIYNHLLLLETVQEKAHQASLPL